MAVTLNIPGFLNVSIRRDMTAHENEGLPVRITCLVLFELTRQEVIIYLKSS